MTYCKINVKSKIVRFYLYDLALFIALQLYLYVDNSIFAVDYKKNKTN